MSHDIAHPRRPRRCEFRTEDVFEYTNRVLEVRRCLCELLLTCTTFRQQIVCVCEMRVVWCVETTLLGENGSAEAKGDGHLDGRDSVRQVDRIHCQHTDRVDLRDTTRRWLRTDLIVLHRLACTIELLFDSLLLRSQCRYRIADVMADVTCECVVIDCDQCTATFSSRATEFIEVVTTARAPTTKGKTEGDEQVSQHAPSNNVRTSDAWFRCATDSIHARHWHVKRYSSLSTFCRVARFMCP
jgi:hypothetical protein